MPLVRWSLLRRSPSARKPGRRAGVAGRQAEVLEERTLLTAYVVDSLADTVVADGRVTLREAILASNANGAVGDAAAGQGGGVVDAITFDASLSGGTILVAGAGLTIDGDLTISGLGADRLKIDGGYDVRVLAVSAASTASISGLTITRGRADLADGPFGGGVLNYGTLVLTGVALASNAAVGHPDITNGRGGGVFNAGTLSLVESVVSGNLAAEGAGVYNAPGGTLTATRSGVTGNTGVNAGTAGSYGGGIYVLGTATVTGCVISGNSADGVGGGLGGGVLVGSVGSLILRDVTVSGNKTGGGRRRAVRRRWDGRDRRGHVQR